MRYTLLSDIHANRPALRAVLAHVAAQGDAGALYHLGDLVGYASWPNEVVDMIAAAGIAGVAGNYDSTVATGYKHCGCQYEDPKQEALSYESYAWTLAQTSDRTKRFLGGLPFRIDVKPRGGHLGGPTVTLVHGTPLNNLTYWTEERPDAFCRKMASLAGATLGDVIAFGHTHQPWHREIDGVHFVNAGSVGRPKDGDWRACYATLDVGDVEPHVDFVRIEYDVNEAMQGIRDSTLPNDFAEYLRTGGRLAQVSLESP